MTNTQFDAACEKLLRGRTPGDDLLKDFVNYARQLRKLVIDSIDYNDTWDEDHPAIGWGPKHYPDVGTPDDPAEYEP